MGRVSGGRKKKQLPKKLDAPLELWRPSIASNHLADKFYRSPLASVCIVG